MRDKTNLCAVERGYARLELDMRGEKSLYKLRTSYQRAQPDSCKLKPTFVVLAIKKRFTIDFVGETSSFSSSSSVYLAICFITEINSSIASSPSPC